MHYSQRLDSPPPPSQFRRPWSPMELHAHTRNTTQPFRREPSGADASLEVLDLADYTMSLHRDNDFATEHRHYYPEYPSTPPRRFSLTSRGSVPTSPPSLVSGMSSSSHVQSPRLHTPPPSHRPFSLPTSYIPRSSPASNSGQSHNYPWLVEHKDVPEQTDEVDISKFPDWSRSWYRKDRSPGNAMVDPYSPIPTFDPALIPSSYDTYMQFPQAQPYSSTSESHRNLLPWAPADDGRMLRVTPEMKEERMRMLEREFGRKSGRRDTWGDGEKIIGSVNAKGNIITPGPKKRIFVRWMQGTFVLGAVIASLYSALILKPIGNPPPKGTVPAYLLYFLSVITLLLLIYMLIFRPCCCSGKRSRKLNQEGPGGLMVLPVQQLPGPSKKKKKGKKKGKDDTGDGVSVNLIVDPSMFGGFGRREGERDGDGDDGDTETASGQFGGRRGLFEGLAMEQQWIEARKQLKLLLFFDITLFFLWGAEFVVILLGNRCPIGKFDGWCDGYNVATALAALLIVLFGLSVFFDVKDLHLSKASPRTRT